MLVSVLEPAGRFRRDADRGIHRELALAAEPVAQGLALDVRHGEPQPAPGLAGVEDREDVGMLEPGGEADLALEALGAERRGELRVEQLEGDRAVVLEVRREPDRGHAAASELALERVAVSQALAQQRHRVGHEARWMG